MPVAGGPGNPPYPVGANSGFNSAPYPPATQFPGGFPAPYAGYNSGSSSAYPPYPTGATQLPYPQYPSYPAGPVSSNYIIIVVNQE